MLQQFIFSSVNIVEEFNLYLHLSSGGPTVLVDTAVTLNAIFSLCGGKLSDHPSGTLTYPSDGCEVSVC